MWMGFCTLVIAAFYVLRENNWFSQGSKADFLEKTGGNFTSR